MYLAFADPINTQGVMLAPSIVQGFRLGKV
ncbi:hypothetical protein [Candidatus Nitrospira nitrosa]